MSEAAEFGFTCVTCQLQFQSAALQREHFTKSDLHRYNAKRKVADLQPITAEVFNEKIAQRQHQLTVEQEAQKQTCKACVKKFNSKNAYDDHLNSKKHRENVLKAVKNMSVEDLMGKTPSGDSSAEVVADGDDAAQAAVESPLDAATSSTPVSAAEDAEMTASTSKAQSTMPQIEANSCLFCPRSFDSLEINLKHMANNHAFYIPDAQYCVDIPGLLQQLGEDIALGNICIFCGHGFGGFVTGAESDAELVKRAHRGLHAVRKHMVDKIHCRIPWDTDDQRLEYSDHYDFTSTWGAAGSDDEEMEVEAGTAAEWEDEDGSDIDEGDEVVMDYSAIRKKTRTQGDDQLETRLQQGESEYELVLPSGTRIGHRALKGIYKANVMPYLDVAEPKDKIARIAAAMTAKAARREEHHSALVPRKDGSSLEMVVARNAGEARHAKRDTKLVSQQRKWDRHALKVGMVHNSQKHYRDFLLQ